MSVNYHKYVGDEEWEAFETPSSRQQVTQSHISDAQKGLTEQDLVNNIGQHMDKNGVYTYKQLGNIHYTIQLSIIEVLIID